MLVEGTNPASPSAFAHPLELQAEAGVQRKGGNGVWLMLRLLVLGLIGLAAYRIGKEMVDSVPSDFEPMPTPAGTSGLESESAAENDPGHPESSSDVGDR